jgi:hypothetical protein
MKITTVLRNARNREDAAQRLQRFVHWEVSFEETFHHRFAAVALDIHGLHHRSKTLPVYSTMIFLTHFFIKFSGSQTFFEKLFSKNINICIRHYWLNRYLLWSSTTG